MSADGDWCPLDFASPSQFSLTLSDNFFLIFSHQHGARHVDLRDPGFLVRVSREIQSTDSQYAAVRRPQYSDTRQNYRNRQSQRVRVELEWRKERERGVVFL